MADPNPALPTGGEPPAPSPAPVEKPTVVPLGITNEQLNERLAQSSANAQKALLKELGYESPDAAKAALKTLKDLQTAQLSETEKRDARIKELEPLATQATTLSRTLDSLVKEQFDALPEAARTAIDAVAAGDPSKRLDLMRVIKAASGAAPVAPAGPAPKPAPITATPSPAPAPVNGVKTKFDEWQEHEKTNPMLGDLFYQNNARAIENSRPAS